ncbi:Hypothetical predicted protein, partial [Pelobates cultripes]
RTSGLDDKPEPKQAQERGENLMRDYWAVRYEDLFPFILWILYVCVTVRNSSMHVKGS